MKDRHSWLNIQGATVFGQWITSSTPPFLVKEHLWTLLFQCQILMHKWHIEWLKGSNVSCFCWLQVLIDVFKLKGLIMLIFPKQL
jgi:hypothetical protein